MKTYDIGILGATGMVGQRLITLLDNHPWFRIRVLAASARSAGRPYRDAVDSRWMMTEPCPDAIGELNVYDAIADFDLIVDACDLVFCAIDLDKKATLDLEERYAKAGIGVISNNSANRGVADVPMLIPELNADHAKVIEAQRKRLGTSTGFIAVKSNCSIQSYVPLLYPLLDYQPIAVSVCTYQAISGAGKSFATWPEMVDNVIPYIGGEDEKSEKEPLKVFGTLQDGAIVDATFPAITAQCVRVPVTDGHMAAVSVKFRDTPAIEDILARWRTFKGIPQVLGLPSAPRQFIHYFDEENRPQTSLDRDLENGMAISAGRLRPDPIFDVKFIGLSHNTLRGAAGGAVLMAELLTEQGYVGT